MTCRILLSPWRKPISFSDAGRSSVREFRGSSLGVELNFGLKENLHHGHFPASAYRGPWLPLLRDHPERGIDLFVSVFNHSADWYAHPRVRDRLEPAFQITLDICGRDDAAARGSMDACGISTAGRPSRRYVLQSMAIPRSNAGCWSSPSRTLMRWTPHFSASCRRSHSGALTAVVASVATAFPHASGETLLWRSSRHWRLIRLDAYRVVGESEAPSGLNRMFPRARGADEIQSVGTRGIRRPSSSKNRPGIRHP